MRLSDGMNNKAYIIQDVETQEEGMREFLLTLGCFPGEYITILSRLSSQFVVNLKDARYSLDEKLASAIRIGEQEELRRVL
ncbi:MAG: ferrous iron transport protein A [Spirochaetales bacterium]|nr:ferrous iron transport protein A [Spirochaetales bacterium]